VIQRIYILNKGGKVLTSQQKFSFLGNKKPAERDLVNDTFPRMLSPLTVIRYGSKSS
jgi:hypothetical protein